MLVNLFLRSLNWPDVAVLLQSHIVLQKHPKFVFFTKNKPNKYATLFSQLALSKLT